MSATATPSRRAFLATAATAGTVATSGCLSMFGLGGGGGGRSGASVEKVTRQQSTDVARNIDDLKSGLVSSGSVVWIPPDVTIDTGGEGNLFAGKDVTLASDGGTIKQPDYVGNTIYAPRGGFRATGVRFHGPDERHFTPDSNQYPAAALNLRDGKNLVVRKNQFGKEAVQCGLAALSGKST